MKKISRVLVPFLFLCGIVGLDQWTKYLTIKNLSDGHEVKLIGDAVVLSYTQNRGMAWGLFQNAQIVLVILTALAIAAVVFLYVRTPFEPEYRPIRIAEVMLVGGAVGNLIDRIFRIDPMDGRLFHGYVVDMIYVKAINFPIFNVADIFVSLAFLLLIFLLIFVYNEEEFNKCFGNFPVKEKAETFEAENKIIKEVSGKEEITGDREKIENEGELRKEDNNHEDH
mgnify:CR=1 FL=1